MLENRINPLKAKSTTSGFVVQKAPGPSLRPRAALGDLTKAVNTVNQVKNEQPDEKIKKPAMGIAPRKPLQSTKYFCLPILFYLLLSMSCLYAVSLRKLFQLQPPKLWCAQTRLNLRLTPVSSFPLKILILIGITHSWFLIMPKISTLTYVN